MDRRWRPRRCGLAAAVVASALGSSGALCLRPLHRNIHRAHRRPHEVHLARGAHRLGAPQRNLCVHAGVSPRGAQAVAGHTGVGVASSAPRLPQLVVRTGGHDRHLFLGSRRGQQALLAIGGGHGGASQRDGRDRVAARRPEGAASKRRHTSAHVCTSEANMKSSSSQEHTEGRSFTPIWRAHVAHACTRDRHEHGVT